MATKLNPGKYDCLENVGPDEPFFVLRANDPLAPDIVKEWAHRYFIDKKNSGEYTEKTDEKFSEAIKCAGDMEEWKRKQEEMANKLDSGLRNVEMGGGRS